MAARLVGSLRYNRDNDNHNVVGIQGPPGIGKSTLGLGLALNLDPDFSIENVHYNRDEWADIIHAPKKSIFILDEGANVAMNRTWMEKGQTRLMQILNMIRQRNHTLIWATPNVQRLDIVIREDLLTHKINCYPAPIGRRAKVMVPRYGTDGQASGWRRWKGKLSWPSLETHKIWGPYTKAKSANFTRATTSIGTMEDPYNGRILDAQELQLGDVPLGKARRDPLQRQIPKPKRHAAVSD